MKIKLLIFRLVGLIAPETDGDNIDGFRNTEFTYFKTINKKDKKANEIRSAFGNNKLTLLVWLHLKNWKIFSRQT